MISIVCPCFNEGAVIAEFVRRLQKVLGDSVGEYELLCINDGSTDDTLEQLLSLRGGALALRVLDLSRRFGKEAAISAGLDHADGDAVVVIDADLQDPPELIPRMVERWRAGVPVVLAHRADRQTDLMRKRTLARWFYRLHNRIADTRIPEDVGDYRLMDRQVVKAVRQLPERQRFMKGLFAWVGFEVEVLDYVREPRSAGSSKFNWWRLWNFGLEGITGFSTAPLRVWTYIGLALSLLAFIYGTYTVVKTLLYGVDVPGYASLLTVVLFLGGIQLISLGVIGEYLGRVYLETKQRPLYIVRREY